MKSTHQPLSVSKTLLALALLAAFAPAYADDEEVAQLIRPTSSITVGIGALSGDEAERTIFGQYNGLRPHKTTLQLDMEINRRDEATGTWLRLSGNNLGLDSRDLSISYEKQGAWKIGGDYSELVRHELRTINSGLLGAGTETPTVVRLATPGSGQNFDLQFKRVGMGLTGEMWFGKSLQMELAFKNEDKTGARTFGTGYACAAYVCSNAQNATAKNQTWALLMLPEPVDSTTRQIEAKLNYHNQNLTVSAGYYGSFFTNGVGSIRATVPNSLNNPVGDVWTLSPAVSSTVIAGGGTSLQNVLQLPVSLQPDNQAHQFYVSGSFRFSPSTNSTFKVARTRATQDEDFAAMGLTNAPVGVTNLGGVVDTTLVQLGVTARPMPKLSLLANVRYEKKDDKTPHEHYNIEGGAKVPATTPASYVNRFWENYHVDSTKLVGKLEASYQLPAGIRATLGLDHSTYDRPVPISITEEELAGLGAVRAKNEENGYRLELRRAMSETLSGSLSYTNSKRTGGDWTSLNTSAAFAAAGLGYGKTGSASQFLALNAGNAFPMNMSDVDREKVRLSASWMPTEQVEVQFNAEDGKDTNANPFNEIALGKGWRSGSNQIYSIDASFAVTDSWKINGYASQGKQNLKVNHSTGYMADLTTRSDSFGLGVTATPTSKLEMGVRLAYLKDNTVYGLAASPTVTGTLPNITQVAPSAANQAQVAIGLPDVRYETTSVNLFGTYALRKNADIRFNLIHQRSKFNEWSWSNNGRSFVYSDNTTLAMNPDQTVTFLGLAYVYKFQ